MNKYLWGLNKLDKYEYDKLKDVNNNRFSINKSKKIEEPVSKIEEPDNILVEDCDILFIKIHGPSNEGYKEFKKKRDLYDILN